MKKTLIAAALALAVALPGSQAMAAYCFSHTITYATICRVDVGNGTYKFFYRDYDGWSAYFPY